MNIIAPRGTYDAMPGQVEIFQHIEMIFRSVAERFGYREIRTPVFEHTELFERGVGETTDIVQKEMYTFLDKGNRSITLRPEGTAPVVRAFVEHKIAGKESMPVKYYYAAIPILRYERPQGGRLRQHHQFGVEMFGSGNPAIDAEIILLLDVFYRELGLSQLSLEINSVGCPVCRPAYREKLHAYFSARKEQLCTTCLDRLDKNPLRILDCKNQSCQDAGKDAPVMVEHLCEECSEHYRSVKENLSDVGLVYTENPRLVRGLDYYTKTAFEFSNLALSGAGAVIGGGGRYDGLVEELGGSPTPGMGFGTGLERIALALEAEEVVLPAKEYCQVFILAADEAGEKIVGKLLGDLRRVGIAAERDYLSRSFRAQMKHADRLQCGFTIILGQRELESGEVTLRNMKTGEQENILMQDIREVVAEKLLH